VVKKLVIGKIEIDSHFADKMFGTERTTRQRYLVSPVTPPKDVDDEELMRRLRLLQAKLRRFNHDNIAKTRILSQRGNYYIVREFVSGTPLENMSDLEPEQRYGYVERIGEALNQARQFGIAHGRLGGSKIIITEDKKPVLVGVGEKQTSLGLAGMEKSTIDDLIENDMQSLQEMKQTTVRTAQANPLEHAATPATAAAIPTQPTASLQRLRRYVNTWFKADDELLRERQQCTFKFNIGPKRGSGEGSSSFTEPDIGNRNEIEILATLSSDDFEIEKDGFEFTLQKTGTTDTFSTPVTPLRAGADCTIELELWLRREKMLLQVLAVTTSVAAATEVTVSVA